VNLAYNFTFSVLTQASSLGAVFDQYRLAEIEVTIRPTYTTAISGMLVPLIYSVIDYDDSTTLTGGASTYEAYTNCTTTQFETVVRRWRPHASSSGLTSGGLVAGVNIESPWIDIANSTVEHFGLKLGMDAGNSGALAGLTINFRALVQVKNVR
jgi:hypothetical protein